MDIFSFVNLSLHTSSFKVIWHTHTHDNYRIPWLDNNESKIYNDNDSCRRRLIELYLHIRNKAEIIWNRGQKNFPSNFCQTSNGASSKIRGSRAWFFFPVRCFLPNVLVNTVCSALLLCFFKVSHTVFSCHFLHKHTQDSWSVC